MAITIQDLLASDTISQAVDKINFNFDQLLLNGGGPQGPNGPQGPPGPVGGRGERGSDWYDGTASPNTFIVSPSLISGDYYLQAGGDVWEYNGTLWVITPVNLLGPTGTPGTSDGWLYIGNDGSGNVLPVNKNTLYPSGMPGGAGANASNQGVSMVLVGGVTTNTPTVGYSYTSAYQLTDTMTASLDSTLVSMLIHQKNSSTRALKFMGGGANAADQYEQNDLSKLASIYLGTDDVINIDIPKDPTTITSPNDAIGFNLFSGSRGQNFRAGRNIKFLSGGMGSGSGAFDIADVTFTINEINASLSPQFRVDVLGTNDAIFTLGKLQTPPSSVPYSGYAYLGANGIRLDAQGGIVLNSDAKSYQIINVPDAVDGSLLLANATGVLRKVNLAGGTFSNGIMGYDSTTGITFSPGTDDYITSFDGVGKLQKNAWMNNGTAIYPDSANKNLGKGIGLTNNQIGDIFLGGGSNGSKSRIIYSGGTSLAPPTVYTAFDIQGYNTQTQGVARFVNNMSTVHGNAEDFTVLQLGLSSNDRILPGINLNMPTIPNTALTIGTNPWTDPTPSGSSAGKFYPKIGFAQNADSVLTLYGNEAAGIYMEGGARGYNQLANNPLVISGGSGLLNNSSTGGAHYGKSLHLYGGTSGNQNSSRAGVAVLAAGVNLTANSGGQKFYGGEVYVGFNYMHDYGGMSSEEKAAKGSSRKIIIGPSSDSATSWSLNAYLNSPSAYCNIVQPPRGTRMADDKYVLSVINNRTLADGFDSIGGLTLRTKSNQYGIDQFVGLSTAAYNSQVVEGDNAIISRNNYSSNNSGKPGGLLIALKDTSKLGIRLDPQGQGSANRFVTGVDAPRIIFTGGTPLTSSPQNLAPIQPGQEAFVFNGRQSLSGADTGSSWTPVTFTGRDDSVVISGRSYAQLLAGSSLAGSNSNAGIISWIKIGNVIQATGAINFGNGTGQRIIALPAIGNGSNFSVIGHGTGWTGSANVPVEVVAAGTNGFAAKYNGNWFGYQGGNYRFSLTWNVS